MGFTEWLGNFQEEDNAIGDLSRDTCRDAKFPEEDDHEIILRYLKSMDACPDALDTFEEAWSRYQEESTEQVM